MNRFYELQFEIENKCLLDCIHCSSINSRSIENRRYDNNDILKMVDLFLGNIRVIFTGGEPLLYKNILVLCKQISDKLPLSELEIYTTGNILNKHYIDILIAKNLKQSGVKSCYFSIYSQNYKIHDKWTSKQNSFYNTLKSIEFIKSVGISPKGHLILNKDNYHDIRDVIYFCESIGIEEIRILKLAPIGNAKTNWDNISIPLDEQENLIKQLMLYKSEFNVPITIAGYPNLMPCRNISEAKGCQAGSNLLYINLCGDIYPCACTMNNQDKFRICNIKEIDKLKCYLNSVSGFRKECLNK